MDIGTVCNIMDARGFCFVRMDDRQEHFCHARAFPDNNDFKTLSVGDRVRVVDLGLDRQGRKCVIAAERINERTES